MRNAIVIVIILTLITSCTSINIRPVSSDLKITDVCIEENLKVIVEDFLPVIRNGFNRHGIRTKVVAKPAPKECEYVLTYTAFKTWDMAMYLHHAELTLEKDGKIISSAVYHLTGQGGLSPMKYQSTETKMDPVIDELLANLKK